VNNILIIVSSTCFEYPRIRPQEDLYLQFYGISFMLPEFANDQTTYIVA